MLAVPRHAFDHFALDRMFANAADKDVNGLIAGVHEAGHCTATIAVGGRVLRAAIRYDDDDPDRCTGGYADTDSFADDAGRLRNLAGGIAAERYLCHRWIDRWGTYQGAGADIIQARKILGAEPLDSSRFLNEIFRAKQDCFTYRDSLVAVALEIFDRKGDAVQGVEIMELFRWGLAIP